jgi:hypothetical protein
MVDEEILKIKIEAEEDASSVLKKVDKNLEKFNNDADKVKYLKSQMASFTAQCKGANDQTKKLAKNLISTLKKDIANKNFKFDNIKNFCYACAHARYFNGKYHNFKEKSNFRYY